MPLPSEFSFDTESGLCPDGAVRNVLIQVCSTSARGPEETVVWEGEDCYFRFLETFEETGWNCSMFFYNANWEGPVFIRKLIEAGYEWTASKKMRALQWSVIEDDKKIYKIVVTNSQGYRLTILDDLLQTVCRMEQAADLVRKERPEWFHALGEHTKLHIDRNLYNHWFALPAGNPARELFLEYAKVDAFSQAMISRWLTERGLHENMTGASSGLSLALEMKFGTGERWMNRRAFVQRYPPLDREMQDIVEASLQGGFVWGWVGHWFGIFVHADYSSSYPKEYAAGRLFAGKVGRHRKGEEGYESRLAASDLNYMRWFVVSFSFELKPGMLPCISGILCRNEYDPMKGLGNKKMKTGTVQHKLFTSTYLEELKNHYTISNLDIEEVWVATPRKGDFRSFIRKCYLEKSRPELKGTMERDMWKRAMNAGVHGKTITKTHRKKVIYPGNKEKTVEEINEPKLCSLIGFTAMSNARERLLRHCRMVIEKGFRVLMCDTDSIVAECTEKQFREAIGDWFETGQGFDDLGKFEMETDEDGKTEFNEFKCWGLKRYCELNDGKFRKSAFAGMHEESQIGWDEDEEKAVFIKTVDGPKKGLAEVPVDTRNFFTWTQKVKHWNGECFELVPQEKQARAENVWAEPVSYAMLERRLRNGI